MGRSSAFEVGDKIRPVHRNAEDTTVRTIDYVGPQVIVFTTHRVDGSVQGAHKIDFFYGYYELAPEVFEAGKSYRRLDNETFVNCLYADETVAVIKNAAGAKYLRGQDSRDEYEEI